MYALARSILFRLDAETAHGHALSALDLAHRLKLAGLLGGARVEDPVELMGLRFPNRVGLAAGLDKNADHLDALGALGFGFVEVGTVTPKGQEGNPKPRLFRLPERGAIINRMGFNNAGVDHLVARVRAARFDGVIGINIGKNLTTPVERAVDDYLLCLEKVHAHADYVTVNISSPNTPGLRNLQFGEHLDALLGTLREAGSRLDQAAGRRVPLAVKIAPDMSAEEVGLVAESIASSGIDAVIATNTTVSREAVAGLPHADEQGGLSGRPVFEPSNRVIRELRRHLPELPIIGVGGIDSGEAAVAKLEAGADLVQLYSGFIYRGPALIGECARAIRAAVAARPR
ncbi:MAG: quinone-dependent dihydroorotate dehydrogenase [Halomonas sp.]|jgi:dihydroorotate dehydrogenase|uniref:Dihydroorotate dehydrogenase (quinone) n=1 Tax=Billgrantia tianxiuensis TaxID=2497861 RepID=A0A6I6SS67_9GAMM|nr:MULTISPECIES: quinone-dependent dihydroorotate dehydrogenase [Halomonas]MCE8032477.1 quinone-dependent dihydroorotate dehydrogenase [Halomonas sp. MCCC 1A11057]MDX5433173.1 quinone-dependent dihydroorotate dehydrogenase [Halomonas sp.]MDX5502807.1 quinone-dependent dihydroorotate dehydrogenase [Halomonas sp.]QHC49563.1 quinone-dependent dihydroorotate dehydrogenase [Halomonas tianxiuensis]